MTEEINIYYKPLNNFNIQDKIYNVYLNKNNNLYMPFLNNTKPIDKVIFSLNDDISKELYNNIIDNINYLKKLYSNIIELNNKYIRGCREIK